VSQRFEDEELMVDSLIFADVADAALKSAALH